MKQTAFLIVPLLFLALTACESTIVEPALESDSPITFEYRGGLNTTFNSDNNSFKGLARLVHLTETTNRLDVQLSVKSEFNSQKEQANILFQLVFESESGLVLEGNYIISKEDQNIELGQCDYNKLKSNNDFVRYDFRGSSISLKIETSKPDRIAGSFIFYVDQEGGQRMIEGQMEEVTLSYPTQVRGRFNLELIQL
ncbi:hypothetical protein ACFLSH_00090 [Bacteroidota bacterium]